MRSVRLILPICLSTISLAFGQTKPTDLSAVSPAIKSKYLRPGWRLVDGGWVKPQAKVALTELVRVVDEDGVHRLIAQPATRIEPMLRNWRTSVIEIDDSDYAWKLSCTGRTWDERRADGTQHLQLVAATDDAMADSSIRLTKIDITPQQASVQAAVVDADGKARAILLVLSQNAVELAIAPLGQAKTDRIFRAPSVREMLRDHPADAKAYLVPLMQRLAADASVLQPAAGDVYRVFDDLTVDPLVMQTVAKIVPDLSDRDVSVRNRASKELSSLGRTGVQAAMKIDRAKLPPEAQDRIAQFITMNTHDPRDTGKLLADDDFLTDCLADPDPNVRNRAASILGIKMP